jgi:hypothetical protein
MENLLANRQAGVANFSEQARAKPVTILCRK